MALVSTEAQLRSMSPGPERFMTMNLMSCGPCTMSNDVTPYGRTMRRMKTRDNHRTTDVQGAQTFVRTSTLTNKPDSYGISDIEGTGSIRLHRDTNKPDRQLFHDDIEGSKPKMKSRFRMDRCVDPLVPEYTLPSFIAAPNVSAKFTRDSYNVSDIEGTRSRPLYPLAQRSNHMVNDIEGAQAGWKQRHVRARREAPPMDYSLNVRDITGGGFRTKRETNPLTPSYRVNGMDIADDPIKCRPKALPKAKDSPFYPLTTIDIEGAQPGWRPMPQMNPPMEARRHFRNTNFIGDVPGAQADTVKHSICTDRRVNPLNPLYASLDGEPLANPQTPLYTQPASIEAEAQLDSVIAAEEAAAVVAENGGAAMCGPLVQSPERLPSKTSDNTGDQKNGTGQQSGKWARPPRERPSSEPLRSSHPSEQRDDTSAGEDLSRRAFPASSTPRDVANEISNSEEKDMTIRRLEREVRLLRKGGGGGGGGGGSGQTWQGRKSFSDADLTLGQIGNGCVTSRSWPESAGGNTVARGSSHGVMRAFIPANSSGRQLSGSSEGVRRNLPEALGGVPPRASFSGGSRSAEGRRRNEIGREGGIAVGGAAMEIRSRGRQGSSRGAERLVLRSANGTPRVPLTPSEKRMAREYVDDVTSVRDLL